MLSIKEAIERVQSLYSKGVQSDDSRLSARHIYSKLKSVRTKLLQEKVNKKQSISQWCYDILPCVEMIRVLPNQCPCETPPGCKILRSKYKIPNIMTGHSELIINAITSINLGKVYSIVDVKEFKNKSGNRYTSQQADAFFYNNYLFLSTKKSSEIVTIEALFEDVFSVFQFPNSCLEDCEDCDCESFLDRDFKLDLDTLETTINFAVQELIGIFNQNREDQKNDTKDNLIQESK